ncbi:MAG: hypothetical protein WAW75_08965 [Gallionella sp.]
MILAELRALAGSVPDFAVYSPTSRQHLEWLGKASSLISAWDKYEAIGFKSASEFLSSEFTREGNVGRLMSILYRAIADLELSIPSLPAQAFGPGAVYDFAKSFRDLLQSASTSLLVVDPFLDEQVFDAYLSVVNASVTVRLLAREHTAALKPAVSAFVAQFKRAVEVRKSNRLHDRVVFVDDRSCWVLGQSIKDAAANKPTYLAPLPQDVAMLKKQDYEDIWSAAAAI